MQNTLPIEKFLADELDLSKKEITIYLNLIKNGAMTVLKLSEISDLNRITTHVNIDYLSQKGLVTQVRKGRGSRRLIMAEPIEKLSLIFKKQKAKLEAAEKQLEYISSELSELKNDGKRENGMEIRKYIGKDEVRLIYDDVLKAKEIRTYACTEDILKLLPNNIEKFVTAHKKNPDMYIWEIMEDSEETQEYIQQMDHKRFFCRLRTNRIKLPKIDYLIFDGKVALIEVQHNIISGMIIENINFYENSVAIHKFVWSYLPDYK